MIPRVLIKLGGSALQDPKTLSELLKLVEHQRAAGKQVIVVHGGGPAINQELTTRGIQWKFINGQRQTTPEMIDVIESVLVGKINKELVEFLRHSKVPAVSTKKPVLFCTQANKELMLVGEIQSVKTLELELLLNSTAMPVLVLAPIGFGASGEKFNVNADWAACKIAVALKVQELIFLTDQIGILNQQNEIIPQATPEFLQELIEIGVINGGMMTKVRAMIKSLESGISQVRVLNANSASQLAKDLSLGTIINNVKEKSGLWNQEI